MTFKQQDIDEMCKIFMCTWSSTKRCYSLAFSTFSDYQCRPPFKKAFSKKNAKDVGIEVPKKQANKV